ncbi:hypothetical protein [uncultured Umboniibacter sp.]|uniref:hypothetical protein n=1 Tax=uncultured Umboniibacter sp. TaxID=1798917 RepID=UPI002609E322|nr:hypothetical protein [uncultured Umboniibacter sp.]
MKNILIDVHRPGDFFNQMAIFCALEEEITQWTGQIYMLKSSFYLHPKRLIPSIFSDQQPIIIRDSSMLDDIEYVSKPAEYIFNGDPAKINYNYSGLFSTSSSRCVASHIDSDKIKCVITIDCEKRRFLSQLPLLVLFCEKIKERFGKSVHFINSGMTSTRWRELLGIQSKHFDFEEEFLRNLSLLTGCSYENLWGESMPRKLRSMRLAQCAISTTGTAAVLPNLSSLPSLTFGNQYLTSIVTKRGFLGEREILIPQTETETLKPEASFTKDTFMNSSQLNSYDISEDTYSEYLDRLIANIR